MIKIENGGPNVIVILKHHETKGWVVGAQLARADIVDLFVELYFCMGKVEREAAREELDKDTRLCRAVGEGKPNLP